MGCAALTVRQSVDRARSLALIERAAAFEVTGGVTVNDLVNGCALFDVVDGEGRAVAAFALRVDQFEAGRQLSVTAAGGEGDNGATEAMAAWCERQAGEHIGARVLTCQTRRRGLVRRLERQGYRVTGYVLSKEI
ncbi:hypothetical protein CDN99_25585 [Roseateles aquatilis]|uniref:N-acetyltransferase domain-containing protein n=1 Tax=Roseateles aquatilis TaxID=431061 RepID=A0A246IUC7_9BURK|nr:hypothetical protein CDN99_25585 [Roseateles aquatilis]